MRVTSGIRGVFDVFLMQQNDPKHFPYETLVFSDGSFILRVQYKYQSKMYGIMSKLADVKLCVSWFAQDLLKSQSI